MGIVDNEWYFADPTYEIGYKNGNYYKYYGMNLEQRLNGDEFSSENIYIGKYKSINVREFVKFDKVLQVQ